MPPVLAVIELNFDPLLHVGQLMFRMQTIGVTLAVLAALTVAALMAPDISMQRWFSRSTETRGGPLRLDDMVLIIAGTVPGAVIGGRIVHVISFWDAYAASPLRVFDPSVGSLSLLGAVLGGLVSATYVAHLVGAPVRRWADAAAVPLLLVIGLGKLSQLLGGSGQGLPFDGPWALAFAGDHPWVSFNPRIPSHPAQVYEAMWALAGIPIVLALTGPRRIPVRVSQAVAWADRVAEEGRVFVGALAWFLIGRVLVGFTWRDETILGPLNAEQVLALIGLIPALALLQPGARRWLATAFGAGASS
jgi:phosphatidylglycerol:prolipoprotein diacylglycerol transferase